MTPTTYITYTQLAEDCRTLANRVRGNIVGVLGIPRSGMLAAEMVALHLNLPCTSIEQFTEQGEFRTCNGGTRVNRNLPRTGTVAVIDDSCWLGNSLSNAKCRLRNCGPWRYEFIWAVVYHSEVKTYDLFEYSTRLIPKPRFFEWNLFHHPDLQYTLFDFDGILCDDPKGMEWDQDTAPYEEFLANAPPRWIPTVPIRGIVTGRLQKWHQQSSDWLKRYGVQYGQVSYTPAESAANRRACRPNTATWKGEVYKADADARLFIESDERQAKAIAAVSGKPVICPAAGRVFQ